MSGDSPRVVIVGGGIAGLSAALRLQQQGARVVVLEGKERVGGLLSTKTVDGLILEGAANAFLANTDEGAVALAEELGVPMVRASAEAKRRWIYMNGELCSLPTSPLEFVTSRFLSPRGKARLLLEPVSSPGPESETVFDFARRRLGEEAATNLVAPFVTGIFAGDARSLSVEAAFPRLVELDRQGGLVRGGVKRVLSARGAGKKSRSSGMYSPEHGVQSLVSALADRLRQHIRVGSTVAKVSPQGEGLVVTLENGEEERCDAVVLATEAHHAAGLVAPFDPACAELLEGIPSVSIAVAHLVFHREQIHHALDGFGFLVREGEPLGILGCVFESSLWPNRASRSRVLLRCMVGGSRDPKAVESSDESLVARCVDDLDRVLGVSGVPLSTHIVRWPRAIPQYHGNHRRRVERIEESLEKRRIVVAGNAYHGVSVNDCVAGGRRVVERMKRLAVLAGLLLAWQGCSGSGPGPGPGPQHPADAGDAAVAAAETPESPPGTGNAAITVEWKGAPAKLLRSPGLNRCKKPRRAPLSVHATGGVRGAFVVLDTPASDAVAEKRTVRVAIRDCTIEPRFVVMSGDSWQLTVANEDESPHRVAVSGPNELAAQVSLRVLGHTRLVERAQQGLIRIDVGRERGSGYLFASGRRPATLTNSTGLARFEALEAGSYTATIVHPPMAAGEEPRTASVSFDISAGVTTKKIVSL